MQISSHQNISGDILYSNMRINTGNAMYDRSKNAGTRKCFYFYGYTTPHIITFIFNNGIHGLNGSFRIGSDTSEIGWCCHILKDLNHCSMVIYWYNILRMEKERFSEKSSCISLSNQCMIYSIMSLSPHFPEDFIHCTYFLL